MKGAQIYIIMIRHALACTFAIAILLASCTTGKTLKNGDIIFQASASRQSGLIERATKSPYTHVGIVYWVDRKAFVYEAIGPVTLTPLTEWVKRGKGGAYAVKRLRRDRALSETNTITQMKKAGGMLMGKAYDSRFLWSDDEVYCSELVWKIYYRGAGIRLCEPQPLREYDIDAVLDEAKKRYGGNIPYDEPVVAPSDIYDSPLLRTVIEMP